MTTTVTPPPTGAWEDPALLRAQVRELTERWRARGRFAPRCDAWLRGYDSDFSRALAAEGWLGITWPAERGGQGRSHLARLIVTEELLRAGAPVAAHWIAERQIGPAILRHGSSELQRRFLPRIARGEVTFCLGMSEPESGSDLASVRTVAEPVEGGWRLRGRKIWTSQAHRSSHAYVLARTGSGESKHEGLSEFLVAMDTPGVEVRPLEDLHGEHHFNEVTFDGVFVPAGQLLGTEGEGWRQVTEQLAFERGGMERVLSTYPLLSAALAAAVPTTESGTSAPDPHHAALLGPALARLWTLRLLGRRVALEMDAGRAPIQQAAILKDLGTEFEGEVNELARTVLAAEPDPAAGGDTLLLAQGVLAAPGFTIRGGTTEVLRTLIARAAAQPGEPAGPSCGDDAGLRRLGDRVLKDHGGEPPEKSGALPAVWHTVSELGWPGVSVPEPHGGSGGSLADLAALVEAGGRNTVSLPLAETAWAGRLLAAAGEPVPEGAATVVLPRVGEELMVDDSGLLWGTATRVPWACAAEHLLVLAVDPAGCPALLVVPADAAGLVREPGRNLAGEPRDTVSFQDLDARRLLQPGQARIPSYQTASATGALLRATATVGALEAAVSHTVDHVTVREQFGRPLLAFQAVGATLARMASQLTLARTAAAAAVASLQATGAEAAAERVAAAVIVTSTAATEVARGAHQLHGAMGVTREHPLHRATRRLWSWRDEFGGDRYWTHFLSERLLPLGPDGVWEWLTTEHDNPTNTESTSP